MNSLIEILSNRRFSSFGLPVLLYIALILFASNECRSHDKYIPRNDSSAYDSTKVEKSDTLISRKELTKSPMGAVWRSLVLPGWGQVYTGNYWKAPVFLIGGGTCVYFIFWNNNKYKTYQKEYDAMKKTNPNNKSGLDLLNRQKEYFRDNRDKSYFFLGITYLLAAVDAYVGAYLFDFTVNDNLGLRVSPYISDHAGLSLTLRLK